MKKIFTLIAFFVVTIGAIAQSQQVYEWKNGAITIRTVSEIDSMTFSLPGNAVTFTTGSPSALTESSMTATFSLSTSLTITNPSSTTEQGVCYSSTNEEPTLEDNLLKYGTFYKGSWKATLSDLRSGLQYYYRPYLKVSDAVFYGPARSFTTLGDDVDITYGAVDLGLPSGTLWADRNVGADSPEAYGDYFAWGETEPKENYDWRTYKWCQGSHDTQTKYCTSRSYGTVDNKTVLDLEDDAAYVNMGKDWRMPTYDELNELRNNCTWTWTTQSGTKGYRVTGPNGNSIFLPAAGYRNDSGLSSSGSYGDYWSASLGESGPRFARALYFHSGDCSTSNDDRCYGLTVRAVAAVKKEPVPEVNKIDLGLPSGTLWADRNVGADSPEDYGDYFAWGETTTKSTYDWSTYKWCQGSGTTMTKYCTDTSYGTVDNKTVLDLEDDAAYVNMGKDWRMPTYDELNELNSKCTWTWTTQNGVTGYKVTGPNNNSIFLPAAGYRYDSSLYDVGSYGCYWSALLYQGNPYYAWYLLFHSSGHDMYRYYRYGGHTVRAVAR